MDENKTIVSPEKPSVSLGAIPRNDNPFTQNPNGNFGYPPNRYVIPPIPTKPPCSYSAADRLYAVAAAVLGFVLVKTLINSLATVGFGLMSSVVSAAVTVFNFLNCRRFNMKGSRTTTVIFIANLILSASFLISDSMTVLFINIMFILVGNVYFAYASYKEGNRSTAANALRAAVSPFYEFGSIFGAIFKKRSKKDSRANKKIGVVLLGLALSIPLCVVIISLLGSADKTFGNIFSISFENIIEWIEDNIVENIFIFIFSLPISMYIFAAGYSRAYKMNNEDRLIKLPKTNFRILPTAMCAAFLAPLTVIYTVFTLMQIFHAFTAGILSTNSFDYAEYARSGFFQLCDVTLINLAVISVIVFFSKCDCKKLPKTLKGFIIAFSVLTLGLIVTALSKMILYISIYGMTPRRVETSIFMLYLFAMFAVLIAKQFRHRISVTKIGYCTAAVVLAALSFIPVDALIARYNIKHYEQGEISWMGLEAMSDLDMSAAPVFTDLLTNSDREIRRDAVRFFNEKQYTAEENEDFKLWTFNITRYISANVILENEPTDKMYESIYDPCGTAE